MESNSLHECLTNSLFVYFGDRKKDGRISVIVDTKKDCLLAIPRDIEHIDFVAKYLGLSVEVLKSEQNIANHMIPSHININYGKDCAEEVVNVETGESGLEIKLGAKHNPQSLVAAHQKVLEFVVNGEMPLSKDFTKNSKINFAYAIK